MKKQVIDMDAGDQILIQRRALLDRVLASSLFERSARLREFLRYVGTEAIENGTTSIHEQQIGAAVFGRPAFYDTSQDNIVRVNATELRKRLDTYFATEGANEEIQFEIPRGSYTPVFSSRLTPAEHSAPSDSVVEIEVSQTTANEAEFLEPLAPQEKHVADAPSPRQRTPWLTAALVALALALVIIGALTWKVHQLNQQLHGWRSKPALRQLWSHFLEPGTNTNIVLADTSFSVAQDLTHYQSGLSDYLNFHYQQVVEEQYEKSGQAGTANVLRLLFNRNSGSLSDFRTAQSILNLEPGSPALKLRSGREVSGNSMRHDSVILIGSERSNAWVDFYRERLDFHLRPVPNGSSDIQIEVGQPRPGEQAIYQTVGGSTRKDGYCILAFLPNLSGEGHTLIIAGTDSQATEACGDFVTHESTLASLLKLSGETQFPHFQALLKTSRMADTPVSSTVVAFHAMKD